MANATARVARAVRGYRDETLKHSYGTLSAKTTLYTHAMVGLATTGYLAKFDDTASLQFFGVVNEDHGNPVLPSDGSTSATAGAANLGLDVRQAPAFELYIASVAITDIGKKVYALFDSTGSLDASATTYANFVGIVKDLVYATDGGSPVANYALVAAAYDGKAANKRFGVTRVMAATGAQSLTKFDLNKTILLPNTGAYALTLPAVATTQAGDQFVFVKTTADALAVTLTGNGAETIDGANTLATMDAQFDTATLVSTGTAWIVVSRDIA